MKKIYLLPNLLTTANIFCGLYSMTECLQGNYQEACWAIMAASIFDVLDGQVARLVKATSLFGLEYDSLSDLVSFGVAPSLLLFAWQLSEFKKIGFLCCFLFLSAGALRLARFNIRTNPHDAKTYSEGLPITVGAQTVATYGIFSMHRCSLSTQCISAQPTLWLTLILAFLMVSTVKFPAIKRMHFSSNLILYILLALSVISFIYFEPTEALFITSLLYILGSLLWNLYMWRESKLFLPK